MALPGDRPAWSDRPLPRRVLQPAVRFMQIEAAGGIVLLAGALAGLLWVNLDAHSFHAFWETELTVDLRLVTLAKSLEGWVTDGLMTLFFFVIGLEVKRELVHGELADRRAAALPVLAALGGMIVPALIYTAFNAGGEGRSGWGIPVATDIAFAVGVLVLLGRRVPVQLKVFLLTLAVADDIGGIIIIAVFYTDVLDFSALALAAALLALVVGMQFAGVRNIPAYVLVGGVFWIATDESGIHPTIAAVTLGLLTPASRWYALEAYEQAVQHYLDRFRDARNLPGAEARNLHMTRTLREVARLSRETDSPLERLESALAPWASFLIVPIFAMASAGVELNGDVLADAASSPISWGVGLGLLLGKAAGISLFSVLAVKSGLAILPRAIRWPQLFAVAILGGIGFTVAIFIATLSFEEELLLEDAKIGIFVASVTAVVLGTIAMLLVTRPGGGQEQQHHAPDEVPAP